MLVIGLNLYHSTCVTLRVCVRILVFIEALDNMIIVCLVMFVIVYFIILEDLRVPNLGGLMAVSCPAFDHVGL